MDHHQGSEGISKRRQKRLLKQQRRKETRTEWRQKLKAKKLARSNAARPAAAQPRAGPAKDQLPKRGAVVLDASYEELMTDRVPVLTTDRWMRQPTELHVTSFGGRLKDRFEQAHPDYPKFDLAFDARSLLEVFPKERLVYLTADTDNVLDDVLDDVESGKVYVIGALVDRNRHKNAAARRAEEHGIACARLPIADHDVHLKCSQALACNHVLEIVLHRLNGKDWSEALELVIPRRKVTPPCQ